MIEQNTTIELDTNYDKYQVLTSFILALYSIAFSVTFVLIQFTMDAYYCGNTSADNEFFQTWSTLEWVSRPLLRSKTLYRARFSFDCFIEGDVFACTFLSLHCLSYPYPPILIALVFSRTGNASRAAAQTPATEQFQSFYWRCHL